MWMQQIWCSTSCMVVFAPAKASGIRLVRGEVHQLDERAPNVQGDVADVAGILVWQYNTRGVALSAA